MLDIKFIKENKDLVIAGANKKHIKVDIDKLIQIDNKRLDLLKSIEELRTIQNKHSEEVRIETNDISRVVLIEKVKTIKEKISLKEEEMKSIMQEWQGFMLQIPNIPDISVPEGGDDSSNIELKLVGEKPVFDFEVKDHIKLMEDLDMVSFNRGTKVAGFRGYFLKNFGARLSFALWQYALDFMIKKNYSPMIVPSLVNKELLYGTGYLPQGQDDMYQTQDESYMSGTGEVATMGYFAGEVLDKKDLPYKFISFSPCFRLEAGSHGKDTKGLIRVHEFYKLEQVVLCEASHIESVNFHEELLKNAEEMLMELGLHYRVVVNCGGDLGLGQVKKYDIEAWMPSQNKYRETHSASYFHDFQTRRLNIKYKDDDGKIRYVHSLNNTFLATPRFLAVFVENFQTSKGTILIPEPLRKYFDGAEEIS